MCDQGFCQESIKIRILGMRLVGYAVTAAVINAVTFVPPHEHGQLFGGILKMILCKKGKTRDLFTAL